MENSLDPFSFPMSAPGVTAASLLKIYLGADVHGTPNTSFEELLQTQICQQDTNTPPSTRTSTKQISQSNPLKREYKK